MGLFLIGPLAEPAPVRTARAVQITDDHMVKQDIVQAARGQVLGVQVRVNIQDRLIGKGGLDVGRERC